MTGVKPADDAGTPLRPSLVYLLSWLPAKVAAVDDSHQLCDRLISDPTIAGDGELRHAIDFSREALRIQRRLAVAEVEKVLMTVTSGGLPVDTMPTEVSRWSDWRRTLHDVLQTHLDETGRLALALGERAFDLTRAWHRAAHVAYLRDSRPQQRTLIETAKELVSEISAAWSALDELIRSASRPVLDEEHGILSRSIKRAPPADVLKRGTWSSAFKEVSHWLQHFDKMLDISKTMDAPIDPVPTRPETAEERQLLARIIADPDDVSLRLRYGELAGLRGDVRAKLIRDQLSYDAGEESLHQAIHLRLKSHPEWSAPFIELGARSVELTKGFVSAISIDLDSLLASAERLFSLAPITSVRIIGGMANRGKELARLPQLSRVRYLDLAEQGVTDADVVALVRSGRLSKLRFLGLHHNWSVTQVGVEAIAAATAMMPELSVVNLQLTGGLDYPDAFQYFNETEGDYFPTPEGKALEAKYGPLRWLHPHRQDNGAS